MLSSTSQHRLLWERRLSASIHNTSRNLTDPDSNNALYPRVLARDRTSESPSPSSLSHDHDGLRDITPCVLPSPAPVPTPTPTPPLSPTPMLTPPSVPAAALRRGQRSRKPPKRYGYSAVSTPVLDSPQPPSDPSSFKEAMSRSDCDAWMEAMVKEMASLIEKDVYELVPLPKGKRAIGCRWAYRTKAADASTPSRKKA